MNLHKAVLLKEVIALMDPQKGDTILDCTVGSGGHTAEILKLVGPQGKVIGLDQDEEAIERTRTHLNTYKDNLILVKTNFVDLKKALDGLSIPKVNGILFDLGVSLDLIENADRGFSFQKDGPLDMRMDKSSPASAYDLVNGLPEKDLADIIRFYGEEHRARKIARFIVEARSKKPIKTTLELAEIVSRAKRRPHGRINPATKTFQALRIAVNRELESLKGALPDALDRLERGGRCAVISFHSLEDRIVKNFFREDAKKGLVRIITKKPVVPSGDEMASNPRSRSAKLRVAEKI